MKFEVLPNFVKFPCVDFEIFITVVDFACESQQYKCSHIAPNVRMVYS